MCMYMSQAMCACICICGCVHVCIHMHACCPDGGGGAGSWGMTGVRHLCGSKPRSGQLQWPMFKVNRGLRWLFISRLLHPCWTLSANSHQPSSPSPSLLLSTSTGTCTENACPLGSIWVPVLPHPAHADTYTCSHIGACA